MAIAIAPLSPLVLTKGSAPRSRSGDSDWGIFRLGGFIQIYSNCSSLARCGRLLDAIRPTEHLSGESSHIVASGRRKRNGQPLFSRSPNVMRSEVWILQRSRYRSRSLRRDNDLETEFFYCFREKTDFSLFNYHFGHFMAALRSATRAPEGRASEMGA